MEVRILGEYGYEWAALGMSLSFKDRSVDIDDWWSEEKQEQMKRVLERNANRGLGHNKFRRQITVYLIVNAPRYWWSEFDTYKVGTVAQSESTMHTLAKRDVTVNDFQGYIPESLITTFNNLKNCGPCLTISELKGLLPESYLQRRLVTLNYEVLATIINQRKNHRLSEWHKFIDEIYSQVEHTELLPERG